MRNLRVKRSLQAGLLVLAVFLFLAADNDARFRSAGHKLMCVCGCNQVLLECNHVGCTYSDRMRGELAANIDRGDSEDLVLQSFVQKYGPTVLLAPTTTGFNRVAWIMPFVALLAGLFLVHHVVRTWRHRPAPALADGIRPATGEQLEKFRNQVHKETEE